MLEIVKPMDIEKRSFEIITELLGDTPIAPENELVVKRVIHTSADFDYAKNLYFSPDAVKKGASAIVVERADEAQQIPDQVTVIQVESARRALAYMSAALFGHPDRKLVTIGITGTKGKTTTTYMIKSVLEMAGKKVGLIGTIGAMIGDEHIPSKNTTPESYELHRMFAAMV